MRRGRIGLAIAAVLLIAASLVWRYQSDLIGLGIRWYLHRVGAAEARDGTLERRRAAVAGMHRLLLMSPPPDALVPEMFEVITLLGQWTASGEVPFAWGAYIYTDYFRTLLAERPDGTPPRSPEEVRTALDRVVAFYTVRRRPGETGLTVGALLGGPDTYTKDEIEQAAGEGRQLPLR